MWIAQLHDINNRDDTSKHNAFSDNTLITLGFEKSQDLKFPQIF